MTDPSLKVPLCKDCYWFVEGPINLVCECGYSGFHKEPDDHVCEQFRTEKPPEPKKPKSNNAVWQTKEWKEKRASIIKEDSICAWCGSKERLTIHHPPGKMIRNQTIQIKLDIKQQFDEATKKERPDLKGNRKALKEYRTKRFWAWLQETGKYDTWMHARTLAVEDYYSLDGTIIICGRCHFATHHGKKLCQYCKKAYHPVRYDSCFECHKILVEKEEKENEALDKEMNALGYY